MSLIARIYDFMPGQVIQSAQVDNELNQITNLLGGVSTGTEVKLVLNAAATPPLTLNQTGAGRIQEWQQAGTTRIRVNNSGALESLLTTGTAPFIVASTTVVANLNADLLDGVDGASYVTLTGTQTLTNKTLTSPRIGTNILDTNGNELFNLTATASAVNELTYANAATGNPPTVTASGGDTNIGITINGKGTGSIILNTYNVHESTGRILTRAGNGATPSTDSIAFDGTYSHGNPDATPGSGTVTTTLKAMAANVLGRDGDWIEIFVYGISSGANNKAFALAVDGNAIASSGTYTAADAWMVHGVLMRDSSVRIDGRGEIVRGTTPTGPGEFFSGAWDHTAAHNIDLVTTLTTAGQITISRYRIVKHNAPT